jgi:hypothetical protein
MIWKNKKYYQETQEDASETPVCFELARIQVDLIDLLEVDFKYKLCSSNTVNTVSIFSGTPVFPNECITLSSFKINVDNNTLFTPLTSEDVQNAIDTNSGVLVYDIEDTSESPSVIIGEVTLVWADCD